ncbi:guanylyl and adenylyl cyclase family member, partial [Volvox carteri f. nagariensis]
SDIKGFTEMSKEVPPAVVMTFLNDLYTRFDSLTDVYGVYKVETIGDCYMVAGGLMSRDGYGYGQAVRGQGDTDPLHAMRVVMFARAMLEEAAKVTMPNTGEQVQVRVGIHSGSVMSGVVGQKMPRFCLFGDTINTASRMESTGRPGAIHVSCATRRLLAPEEDEELWAPTGGVEVKGKGRMETVREGDREGEGEGRKEGGEVGGRYGRRAVRRRRRRRRREIGGKESCE